MDNFIQITVFCPTEPRVGAFVYRNVSLRSKRFQSSYSAKFEVGAKKKWKREFQFSRRTHAEPLATQATGMWERSIGCDP